MNEYIKSLIKEYGLNETETNIYLHLVIKNSLTAYQIAKDLHIHRTNCYNILERLIIKGFVSVLELDEKKIYSANELTNVLGKIKNKESILLELIPKIENIKQIEQTYIRYDNTRNSFSQFNTKLYDLAQKEKLSFIYMISNSPNLTTRNSRIHHKKLLSDIKNIKSLKLIDRRAIWDIKFRNNEFMKQFEKLGKHKFLRKLPNNATTFIYDNYVAFVLIEENDSFIEIKNQLISKEMKAYFEYLWKIAEE